MGGPTLSCLDAADVNDDGAVTNADVIYLSNYLNSGGPSPPYPFPTPCSDRTFDTLSCGSSCGIAPECSDGIDNDGDGLTDYPTDCGCANTCDNFEAPGLAQCEDGIDNDGDGLIDLADTNCVNVCDNSECSQNPCSTCCSKPGDVNGDGSWTLTDIVGLVNIVFKGAPKPCPLCRGDCNGSGGNPTLSDIICLKSKVFKGGSNPIKTGVCCLD